MPLPAPTFSSGCAATAISLLCSSLSTWVMPQARGESRCVLATIVGCTHRRGSERWYRWWRQRLFRSWASTSSRTPWTATARTRVGEILAGTPLTKVPYLLGKFLSNFAVLVSMVVVLALAAVAMQLLAAEDRTFHVRALLSPFLFLTLPAMAMTAAMALLFETFRFLRGGFGNVLWFFLWAFGISLPLATGHPAARSLWPLGRA